MSLIIIDSRLQHLKISPVNVVLIQSHRHQKRILLLLLSAPQILHINALMIASGVVIINVVRHAFSQVSYYSLLVY